MGLVRATGSRILEHQGQSRAFGGSGPANTDPRQSTLELFNLNQDFSQTDDLAAKNPEKVKEMKQKFIAEAKKYQVFPMDASVGARVIAPRPNITARTQ